MAGTSTRELVLCYNSFMYETSSLKPFSSSLHNTHFIHHKQNRPLIVPYSPTLLIPCGKRSRKLHLRRRRMVRAVPPHVAAAALTDHDKVLVMKEVPKECATFKVTALVTLRSKKKGNVKEIMLRLFDALNDSSSQNSIVLQLVSTEIDPKTEKPRLSNEAVLEWPKSLNVNGERVTQRVEIMVDSNFGVPGAIIVRNKHQEELFFESISVEGVVHIACNSWVQPEKINSSKRVFFTNKAYLPWDTPMGLKELREEDLRELRGDGKGLRIPSDRIYDYDMYNDLGNPEKESEYVRPTLGGEKNPYPRRCRTGRPPTNTDANVESTASVRIPMYVPRDEALGEPKNEAFSRGKLKGMFRNMIPLIITVSTKNDVFGGLHDIYGLYKQRPLLENESKLAGILKKLLLPKVISKFQESIDEFLKFDPPKIISGDTFCLRDDEFGRQAIAGINPLNIERLQIFPPMSKLDPSMYGPQESAIKQEHIIGHLDGMSIQQALDANRLFILDYHDIYLPFLDRINAIDGRKAHATRTLFFLTSLGTLKPIAIELSLLPPNLSFSSKQVLTPPVDATTNWLWQLGKAHVCSNDAGVHQLVNHWLRTHACMEPFIIAAHRQLSSMHPIFKLLDPHMRYTLEINAQAREILINSEGIVESCFTPEKYCMELSCAAYRDFWRFDLEGLPADLIRRGVAVPDQTEAHGLRLLIQDYPYANDGLLIWAAIETLVQTYVNYYYLDPTQVQADLELQAWYNESINVGHADVSRASWWPKLSSPNDLVSILTTLIWLATAQHAALNFGQYPYGGYVPNRSPLMRQLVPEEHDPNYADFVANPQGYLLLSLPSLFQATKFMAVIDIISAHSPDEEYIGERKDLSGWAGEPVIVDAFYRFLVEIRRIENEIEKRNGDSSLRNRCGAGITPYELLVPSSGPGVTCRGVPNSITV